MKTGRGAKVWRNGTAGRDGGAREAMVKRVGGVVWKAQEIPPYYVHFTP